MLEKGLKILAILASAWLLQLLIKILLENQFNIGDEVNLGGNWQGKVVKISLRTTTLKDKKGKIYIIPNSAIKAVIKLPKA